MPCGATYNPVMLQWLLTIIPADSLPTFLAALAVIVGAAVVWIGRKIGSYLEKLGVLKMDETKINLLDQVGEWAVQSTNQYFKKYTGDTSANLGNDKLEYAIKQARLNLPANVSETISDAQLRSVIEAKVAKTNAVAGVSALPAATLPSVLPTGKLPPPSKIPKLPE